MCRSTPVRSAGTQRSAEMTRRSFLKCSIGLAVLSIAGLKGKSVAITKVGQTDYVIWKHILARQGWKEGDVTFVPGNTIAGQVGLLQRGDAQGAAVSPPNDVLCERAGAHLVLDTAL